jgi:DNA-binding PadR family transcriptional regulator
MKPFSSSSFPPFGPAALYILLALSGENRHGYAIMQEIGRQTGGKYKPGPGTLYDNLEKLLNLGLIDEAAAPMRGDDPRRRYYRLTKLGQRALAEEIRRLEAVTRIARENLGISTARSAL